MRRTSMTKWVAWLTVLALAVVAFLPALPAQAEPEISRFDVKFSGVITDVPAAPGYPIGAWKVAGRDVAVTAATRVLPRSPVAAPGMWAEVMAKRQTDGKLLAVQVTVMPPEIRIKGPISAKPDDPNGLGNWTIAGLAIAVTADTKISQRGSPLDVGKWAEVYALQDNGALIAVRLRGIETQPDVEIFGAIEAFGDTSWTLSGINLVVDADTLIQGSPALGLLANASASLQDDSSLLALRLRVAITQPGGPHNPLEFDGTVEKLPERGNNLTDLSRKLPGSALVGEWMVSGKPVMVSANTAINQEQGLVVVGAQVHVVGWQIGERIMAIQIVVLSSPAPGGQFVRFRGPIEALPTSGLIGQWKIGGRTVDVTAATRLDGESRAKVGAIAEVGGIKGTDGVVTATWVKVESRSGPGPH